MAKPARKSQALTSNVKPAAALSVEEVMVRTGLGRTTLYRVIRAGGIVARKSGRRTVFLESDVASYLASLPRLVPKQSA